MSFSLKNLGKPTTVQFHVTVLSVDSIDEESMVNSLQLLIIKVILQYLLFIYHNKFCNILYCYFLINFILHLRLISFHLQTYVADIFLAQSWQDYRLRLPENMTEGYRILDVGWLQYIWRPDSFFKNAKKVTFHEMSVPNHYLWLYYDKTLLYMAK